MLFGSLIALIILALVAFWIFRKPDVEDERSFSYQGTVTRRTVSPVANIQELAGKPVTYHTADEEKSAQELAKIREERTGLTEAQQKGLLEELTCPDCGSVKELLEGPRGGLAVNVKCGKCGSKFNLAYPFFAERI